MKILPMMSAGEPLIIDGTLHLLPLQVFRTKEGMTIIRIGDNTIWFDENGVYDGTEMRAPELASAESKTEFLETANAMLEESVKNRNQPPQNSYFEPGSDGYREETKSWGSVVKPSENKPVVYALEKCADGQAKSPGKKMN